MFSGDSSGLIIVWDTSVKGNSQHLFQHWRINKVYRFLKLTLCFLCELFQF